MKKLICIIMLAVLCLCFVSCGQQEQVTDVWESAIYKEDTELGKGGKTVFVEVKAMDKTVTFTINSDKKTLGEALMEHKLIEGEKGAYGLYVKKVNGIEADYDKNQCYWGFNKNGEGMLTGVDGAEFKDGEHYELVYTKN